MSAGTGEMRLESLRSDARLAICIGVMDMGTVPDILSALFGRRNDRTFKSERSDARGRSARSGA
jgi:hypothetical protein